MIGKTFYEETIRFSFSDFEEGLQKTRFGPVDLQILLEEYFGKKLRTHQSEMDEGCHHCKKIRLSADHKRI